MKDYAIGFEVKELLKQDMPRVKAAIATLANAKFLGNHAIEGIYKNEGGVRVNGKEIAIYSSYVVHDFGVRGRNPPTPEEEATVDAIMEVAKQVEANGLEWLESYEPCEIGDPLRRLVS